MPYGSSETDWIKNELKRSLERELDQSQNLAMTIVAGDDAKVILGGLTATTSYGWLHIATLWVTEECRGQGIGAALLNAAEQHAITVDCHASWLETSNPRAKRFYLNQGFELFGRLSNEDCGDPAGHHRWFLKKRLDVK